MMWWFIHFTRKPMNQPQVKIKKIKCPKCHCKIDPTQKAFDNTLMACLRGKKCGLTLVNRDKLSKNSETPVLFLPPVRVDKTSNEPMVVIEIEDPLVVHIFDPKTKQVISE